MHLIGMSIKFDGEPDTREKEVVHLAEDAPPIVVHVLSEGMESGRPSVALCIELPDGRLLVAQTSARLFCTAGRAIRARYPDLFTDTA